MEISDYLRIIRRRIWIVLAIPVLAAVLVGAIVLNRPAEYSATATVAAPWLISEAPGGAYETANASRQFVADFIAATTLPPVVDAVAEATGASQGEIRENATATPIGESTLIQVRYITREESEAAPAVRALALETLRFLFRPSAVAQESATPVREDRRDEPLDPTPTEQLELLLAQPQTLSMSPTSVEPSGPELRQGLQIAVGGGLLLSLLVVILLELLPPDRLRRQAAPEPGHLSPKADEASAGEDESAREVEGAREELRRVRGELRAALKNERARAVEARKAVADLEEEVARIKRRPSDQSSVAPVANPAASEGPGGGGRKVSGTREKRAARVDEGGEGGRKVGREGGRKVGPHRGRKVGGEGGRKVGGTREKRAARADEGGDGGRKVGREGGRNVGERQRQERRSDGQGGAADGSPGRVLDGEAHKADPAGDEQKPTETG